MSKITEIPQWCISAKPLKIVGPISFVGTKKLGVWLIETSPDRYILMNTGTPCSAEKILKSLRQLQVDPAQIKILLACHPHIDHVGALARLQQVTGAHIWMTGKAKEIFESGGKADFAYGKWSLLGYPGTAVDRVLTHKEKIRVGDITLTVLHTPGHSQGSTTFMMNVIDHGNTYCVVFPDGTGVNPGYQLVGNLRYPEIAEDYRKTFITLRKLKPNIWLAPHLDSFHFDRKRALAEAEMDCRKKAKAWADPDGYAKWLCCEEKSFLSKLSKQTPTSSHASR